MADLPEAILHTGQKSVHFWSFFDFLRKKWRKVTEIVQKLQNFRSKPCSTAPETPIHVVYNSFHAGASPPLMVQTDAPMFFIIEKVLGSHPTVWKDSVDLLLVIDYLFSTGVVPIASNLSGLVLIYSVMAYLKPPFCYLISFISIAKK